MNEYKSSHRQILKSSAIFGGSSAIYVLIGMLKVKVLAVLLSAGGVGLMGAFQNILNTGTMFFGFGLGNSGVRQLAATNGDAQTFALVRRALIWGSFLLGTIALCTLWLIRHRVSVWVFDDAQRSAEVGLLGLGVLFSVISSSQMAQLQGLRRVGDLARLKVFNGMAGAVIAITIIWMFGQNGVVWFVLSAPLVGVAIGRYYVGRLPEKASQPAHVKGMVSQLRTMMMLGMVFMVSGFVMQLTQMTVRSIVIRDLGLAASGHFQAAWQISMLYIGFILTSMTMDYYPRLSHAMVQDRVMANRMVNEQQETALLLAAPVLLGMMSLAPWVITLLYSSAFGPSVELLRWQIMGDVVKVFSWPMGLILVARGEARKYFLVQLSWNVNYLAIIWLGLPKFGLSILGFAYMVSYLINVFLIIFLVGQVNEFRISKYLVKFVAIFFALQGLIFASSHWLGNGISAAIGCVITLVIAVWSLKRLVRMAGLGGKIKQRLQRYFPMLTK